MLVHFVQIGIDLVIHSCPIRCEARGSTKIVLAGVRVSSPKSVRTDTVALSSRGCVASRANVLNNPILEEKWDPSREIVTVRRVRSDVVRHHHVDLQRV